jgi:ADP-heptose:LPS heptosyltransferase
VGLALRVRSGRVLVILDNCHEADALRLMFCLSAIRRSYRSSHITLLVNERASAVFERVRPFDRLVISRLYQERSSAGMALRVKKTRELARLAVRVRTGYDVAITLGMGSTLLNLFARLAARRSIGFANKVAGLLSSRLGPFDPYGDLIAQHLELLRACGVFALENSAVSLRAPTDDEYAIALLRQHRVDEKRMVVLHAGSDWACQQWLVDRWAKLADVLVTDYGMSIVFTGVAAEGSYIERIRASMRAGSVSLAGATTLPQLEALISRARLCVCVDSAVYDLALGTRTPVVVLAGPTDTRRGVVDRPLPMVVNRTPSGLRDEINRCKEPKDIFGGCLNYECPMAGLRDISVSAVLEAVVAHDLRKQDPGVPAAVFS